MSNYFELIHGCENKITFFIRVFQLLHKVGRFGIFVLLRSEV